MSRRKRYLIVKDGEVIKHCYTSPAACRYFFELEADFIKVIVGSSERSPMNYEYKPSVNPYAIKKELKELRKRIEESNKNVY